MADNGQKIIERKCQGCGKILDRKNFIKITLNHGKLYINPNSKILGRSMYICTDQNCIKTAIKKKRIINALKFKNFDEIKEVEKQLLEMVF